MPIGPVVKVDPATLPANPNIHYLGSKTYQQQPHYTAGWDVALLPFARNEATRLISPTKTPENMAAGKPVVSTSIRDVIRPYGQQGLVRIGGIGAVGAARTPCVTGGLLQYTSLVIATAHLRAIGAGRLHSSFPTDFILHIGRFA